jgi:hypothetical protein
MNRSLHFAVFAAGLATVGWVGAGYIGTNPLALAVTVLVSAAYLVGALELRRFHQATLTLARAVADAAQDAPASLGDWLGKVHPSLRSAVRLRIEGERVSLPGPAMAPYLAGLLVLLGMLGTFLGMVATLKGTGLALESASDLQSIRDSLSAPVKGLGLAFGTSVAGVAASAMLGLLSALCRRERLQAAQLLDTRIATTLRAFSIAHHREASFKLLQRQAELMPEVLDRLQAWMAGMQQQDQALKERLIAGQEAFHGHAEAAYAGLAASVDRSLRHSLTESARAAGAAIQPVAEATMAAIARETASLHGTVTRSVQQQLDGLSTRFEATTATVAGLWKDALADQQRANEAVSDNLGGTLERYALAFEQRSASLVEDISTRLEGAVGGVSETWRGALAQHERSSDALSKDTRQALAAAAATFEQHSASLLRTVGQAHADLQAAQASQDQQRLAAWTQSLEAMAASLRQEWQQAGAQGAGQLRQLGEALAQTAGDISAQAQAHAKSTLAEIAQLVQAASEAPRAAADMVTELRQKLSDSMARDNTMLEERGRILETLATLLDAVNHASTEQRAAIDALVTASTDLLDRVGSRFTQTLDAQTEKMAATAAQVTGSAVEVASLGESFGLAVQLFSQSNDKLVAHLQRIEGALSKSLARSDEQLDYYVAQAREVIDLSIGSQKQIIEDLQRIAGSRALAGSEA